jgi:hypothetical protein
LRKHDIIEVINLSKTNNVKIVKVVFDSTEKCENLVSNGIVEIESSKIKVERDKNKNRSNKNKTNSPQNLESDLEVDVNIDEKIENKIEAKIDAFFTRNKIGKTLEKSILA